jgi:PAS domain S-box-containing protein
MPPGWDGIETLGRIWQEDPDLQAAIFTAYSDYSWEEIAGRFGNTDQLLILKKPFDKIELLQLASASIEKWNLKRQAHDEMKALQQNRDCLFTALQSIGHGVIVTDGATRIIEMNPAAEELAGRKREAAIGQRADEIIKFIDNQNRMPINPVVHVLSEGQIVDLADDTYLVRNDGCRIPIAICIAPIKSPATEKQGAVLLLRDVTAHRQAQQEIQRQHHEAVEANRLKDRFLAMVSHELRSPLGSILAWVKLLREQQLTQDQTQRGIDVIERNTRSQSRLIEDLVDISRMASGKMKLSLSQVDVAETMRAAMEVMQPTAHAKSLTLELSAHGPLSPIFADPARLHQVACNLLSNSIKYTPSGGRIEVHLQRVGDSMQIVVKDNGMGISAEFLPHVFELFRQGVSTITRAHDGLGLGLAIVKELVAMHGGTIEASSDGSGRGATFTINLPLHLPL